MRLRKVGGRPGRPRRGSGSRLGGACRFAARLRPFRGCGRPGVRGGGRAPDSGALAASPHVYGLFGAQRAWPSVLVSVLGGDGVARLGRGLALRPRVGSPTPSADALPSGTVLGLGVLGDEGGLNGLSGLWMTRGVSQLVGLMVWLGLPTALCQAVPECELAIRR
jgi:hypothetical protein